MEDKVDAGHHIAQALDVAHIADVELDFIIIVRIVGLQLMAHVVLLFSSRLKMRISPISVVKNA